MSPAAPHPSLIQALRTETAELHVALEKRLPFSRHSWTWICTDA